MKVDFCGPGVPGIGERGRMNPLQLFGLFAVTAMLVFYALEKRNRSFILAFAGSCILGSVYGFLQGAWPFGLIEAIWSLIAIHRWRMTRIAD
jgi:hypothetical protein